jgi:hypothetical protein
VQPPSAAEVAGRTLIQRCHCALCSFLLFERNESSFVQAIREVCSFEWANDRVSPGSGGFSVPGSESFRPGFFFFKRKLRFYSLVLFFPLLFLLRFAPGCLTRETRADVERGPRDEQGTLTGMFCLGARAGLTVLQGPTWGLRVALFEPEIVFGPHERETEKRFPGTLSLSLFRCGSPLGLL